jgi:hypothetical protein
MSKRVPADSLLDPALRAAGFMIFNNKTSGQNGYLP